MSYSKYEVYKCDLCKLASVFETEEAVQRHISGCLMNKENKFPLTSENTILYVYPFIPKYAKNWKYDNTHFELTAYVRPFCKVRGRELTEDELYQEDEHWVERKGEYEVVETEEYKEFMALLDEQDDLTVSDEIKEVVNVATKG